MITWFSFHASKLKNEYRVVQSTILNYFFILFIYLYIYLFFSVVKDPMNRLSAVITATKLRPARTLFFLCFVLLVQRPEILFFSTATWCFV